MKTNKILIVSLIVNISIFLLVLTGTIIMFSASSGALTARGFSVFKYFTFQSNIFIAIIALVFAILELLLLKGKIDKMPHVLTVFYFVGTVAVGLTFLVVIAFLSPIYGFLLMYSGPNLFYHALVPLCALAHFVFLEKNNPIHFKETFLSMVPCFLYGIVYLTCVISLNGYGDPNIDFYMFGANGPFIGILAFIIVLGVSYGIGIGIFALNNLLRKNKV